MNSVALPQRAERTVPPGEQSLGESARNGGEIVNRFRSSTAVLRLTNLDKVRQS